MKTNEHKCFSVKNKGIPEEKKALRIMVMAAGLNCDVLYHGCPLTCSSRSQIKLRVQPTPYSDELRTPKEPSLSPQVPGIQANTACEKGLRIGQLA